MNDLLRKLAGGDPRSLRGVPEVVEIVLHQPALFHDLLDGMSYSDKTIRLRTSGAVEKVTAQQPHLLAPYHREILEQLALIEQPEVRWHVAQLLPRLALTPNEKKRALGHLFGYTESPSKIVQVFALQALADFTAGDAALTTKVVTLLKEKSRTGSPAVRARARKLLEEF